MTQIESKTVTVNKPAEETFNTLSDFKNFEDFMPDAVTKFEADDNSFLFAMKGMPEVRLVLDEKVEPSFIKLKSASSKLDFSLTAHINPLTEETSAVKFSFEGQFNAMLRMMVERPLKNFIEKLADQVAAL